MREQPVMQSMQCRLDRKDGTQAANDSKELKMSGTNLHLEAKVKTERVWLRWCGGWRGCLRVWKGRVCKMNCKDEAT